MNSAPGALSIAQNGIDDAISAIANLNDPLERAITALDLLEVVQNATSRLRVARQAALADARRTRSVEQIAEHLGISRARVYEILAEGKTA